MVEHDLLEYQVLEVFFAKGEFLEIKVKSANKIGSRLILGTGKLFKVTMLECLLDGDPFLGVVGEHFLEEIDGEGVGSSEQVLELLALTLGKLHYEFSILLILDLVNQLGGGASKEFGDHSQLLFFGTGWEEGLPDDQLGQDAPH